MNISKIIVLEGKLKFSLIEGRLKMPPTGMQRQCLRLGSYECDLLYVMRNVVYICNI